MNWVNRVKNHKKAESNINIEIDWSTIEERLGKESLCINCKTKDDAKDLLQNLNDKGYRWTNSKSLTDLSYYIYNKDTCYRISEHLKEIVVIDRKLAESKGTIVFEYSPSAKSRWKSWNQAY